MAQQRISSSKSSKKTLPQKIKTAAKKAAPKSKKIASGFARSIAAIRKKAKEIGISLCLVTKTSNSRKKNNK